MKDPIAPIAKFIDRYAWNSIKTALRPVVAPFVNPMERRYELQKARQFAELATLAEGITPQAPELRSLSEEHARRAARL